MIINSRKKYTLFCVLCILTLLCCACGRGGGNVSDSYIVMTSTDDTVNSTDNDKAIENTEIEKEKEFDSLKEQYLYYATSRKAQFDEKDNILFKWNYCLADNGIFYIKMRQLDADGSSDTSVIGGNELYYIAYEKLFELDSTANLYIGMTEKMPEALDSFAEKIDIAGLENATVSNVTSFEDGAVIFLYEKVDDDTYKNYAAFIDNDFNVEIHDITECTSHSNEVLAEQGLSPYYNARYVFRAEGTIYYSFLCSENTSSTMWFYNEKNDDIRILSLDYSVGNVVGDESGNAYWIIPSEKKLAGYNFTSEGEETENIHDVYTFDKNSYISDSADSAAVWTQDGIYSFDIAGKNLVPKLEYTRVGITNGLFDKIRLIGDKNIIAAKFSSNALNVYCFYESDTPMADEKIKLKMTVTLAADSLKDMIRTFNKANGMYEVELEVCEDSSTFITKLLSKDGPDIIDTDMIDLSIYADNGYLEDLYTFLDSADSGIGRDDLLKSVIDTCTYDGKLVAVPTIFFPIVTVGGDYFKDYTAWTTNEYISLIEKGDRLICENTISSLGCIGDVIWLYWLGQMDKLIDFKNYEAHFDSTEFLRFLNAVCNYDPDSFVTDEASSNYWKEDKIYLAVEYMLGCKDIMTLEQIMSGQEPVFLGFPGNDDITAPVYGAVESSSYGISSNSQNKEGAWAFIQFAIRYFDEEMAGFPVYLPNLNMLMAEAQKIIPKRDENYNIITDEEGNPVEQISFYPEYGKNPMDIASRALTDEETAVVYDILDHIGISFGSSSPINEIFYDEIEAMLNKTQTPEQTAAILQDRFTLMLEELQ